MLSFFLLDFHALKSAYNLRLTDLPFLQIYFIILIIILHQKKNYQLNRTLDGTPFTKVSQSHVQTYEEIKNSSLDPHNRQLRSKSAFKTQYFPDKDRSNRKGNLSRSNHVNPRDKTAQHFDALERKNVYKFSRKRSQHCEFGPVWNGDLKVVMSQSKDTMYKNKSKEMNPVSNYKRKNSEKEKFNDKISRSVNKANSEQKKLVALP
jgi:hypothetical protein